MDNCYGQVVILLSSTANPSCTLGQINFLVEIFPSFPQLQEISGNVDHIFPRYLLVIRINFIPSSNYGYRQSLALYDHRIVKKITGVRGCIYSSVNVCFIAYYRINCWELSNIKSYTRRPVNNIRSFGGWELKLDFQPR